ncbi:MAG: phenylacetate--CoA ligase family protein [Acidobacteria bacterium]|nr:phenylacetate--CoA ligase family protein [Acidobacteriota bacterium]
MRARVDPTRFAWPPFVSGDAGWSGLLDGMSETERLPAEDVLLGQRLQLRHLLPWAERQSRYYRRAGWIGDFLAEADRRPDDFWEIWRRVPILPKSHLRKDAGIIHARQIPADQTPIESTITSGSTGITVEVRTTSATRMMWHALTVREHLWQRRDVGKRLGAIRYRPADDRDPAGRDLPSWGPPVASLSPTGPASVIHVGHSVDLLAAWVTRFDPHYLLVYPSLAGPLLERLDEAPSRPRALEELRCLSEPLDPESERALRKRWGVRVSDMYSANEVGHIAFTCERGRLHVQSESVVVEILDDRGAPCAPGDTGRVVVTSLHNLATPLIRYDLGDYATAGDRCECRRGLPVIGQVRGRVRNLVRTPDGRRYWPVELGKIRSVHAIRQAQYVQSALDTIRLNVVADRTLTAGEEARAGDAARAALGYPFRVEIVRVDEIPRGPTGKFEEFWSRIDEPWPAAAP